MAVLWMIRGWRASHPFPFRWAFTAPITQPHLQQRQRPFSSASYSSATGPKLLLQRLEFLYNNHRLDLEALHREQSYKPIMVELRNVLRVMAPQDIAKVAFYAASMGLKDNNGFYHTLRTVILDQANSFSPSESLELLRAFDLFGSRPLDQKALKALVEAVKTKFPTFSRADAISLLQLLGKLRWRDDEFVRMVLMRINLGETLREREMYGFCTLLLNLDYNVPQNVLNRVTNDASALVEMKAETAVIILVTIATFGLQAPSHLLTRLSTQVKNETVMLNSHLKVNAYWALLHIGYPAEALAGLRQQITSELPSIVTTSGAVARGLHAAAITNDLQLAELCTEKATQLRVLRLRDIPLVLAAQIGWANNNSYNQNNQNNNTNNNDDDSSPSTSVKDIMKVSALNPNMLVRDALPWLPIYRPNQLIPILYSLQFPAVATGQTRSLIEDMWLDAEEILSACEAKLDQFELPELQMVITWVLQHCIDLKTYSAQQPLITKLLNAIILRKPNATNTASIIEACPSHYVSQFLHLLKFTAADDSDGVIQALEAMEPHILANEAFLGPDVVTWFHQALQAGVPATSEQASKILSILARLGHRDAWEVERVLRAVTPNHLNQLTYCINLVHSLVVLDMHNTPVAQDAVQALFANLLQHLSSSNLAPVSLLLLRQIRESLRLENSPYLNQVPDLPIDEIISPFQVNGKCSDTFHNEVCATLDGLNIKYQRSVVVHSCFPADILLDLPASSTQQGKTRPVALLLGSNRAWLHRVLSNSEVQPIVVSQKEWGQTHARKQAFLQALLSSMR